jgi:hypothetical protein
VGVGTSLRYLTNEGKVLWSKCSGCRDKFTIFNKWRGSSTKDKRNKNRLHSFFHGKVSATVSLSSGFTLLLSSNYSIWNCNALNFQKNFLPKVLVMRYGSGSGCNNKLIRPDPYREPCPSLSTYYSHETVPLNYSWVSVTFWCWSGSPDPYLWLMDPKPDPTPDPTPFFIDFKDTKKKIFFFIFFLISCWQALHLQSKKFNFLLNFVLKNLILQALFQSAQHIYEKREGSGAGSVPLTKGSRSGRPKNMRIWFPIRIHNTGWRRTCLAPTPTRKPGGTRPKGSRPFFCSSTSFRATTIGFRMPKKPKYYRTK